jgi:hypothetical protein
MGATPILELSFGGDEKRLMDLFSAIEEGRYLEDEASTSKLKGKKELKNLECSINFDAKGSGSSQSIGRIRACSTSLGLF